MPIVFRVSLVTSEYMDSCSEQISPESLQASVSMISKMASGDSVWIASISDNVEELQPDELYLPLSCNHIRVIDIVKAQREDSVIGRVLNFIQNRQKPTIT